MTKSAPTTTATDRIAHARETIARLFRHYEINDPNQAQRLIRERFTQEDLDLYRVAYRVLNDQGAI